MRLRLMVVPGFFKSKTEHALNKAAPRLIAGPGVKRCLASDAHALSIPSIKVEVVGRFERD